jgi:hypothetical protein
MLFLACSVCKIVYNIYSISLLLQSAIITLITICGSRNIKLLLSAQKKNFLQNFGGFEPVNPRLSYALGDGGHVTVNTQTLV